MDVDNVVSNLQDEKGERSRRDSETSSGREKEIEYLLAHAARHRRGSTVGVADLDMKLCKVLKKRWVQKHEDRPSFDQIVKTMQGEVAEEVMRIHTRDVGEEEGCCY